MEGPVSGTGHVRAHQGKNSSKLSTWCLLKGGSVTIEGHLFLNPTTHKRGKRKNFLQMTWNKKMGELGRLFISFSVNPSTCVRNCLKTGRWMRKLLVHTSVQRECSRPGAPKPSKSLS